MALARMLHHRCLGTNGLRFAARQAPCSRSKTRPVYLSAWEAYLDRACRFDLLPLILVGGRLLLRCPWSLSSSRSRCGRPSDLLIVVEIQSRFLPISSSVFALFRPPCIHIIRVSKWCL